MRAPGFWWRPRPAWQARLLQPLGMLYGAITRARMRRPGRRVTVPVICIGNFVAGGAGKTPTAIAAVTALADHGEKPFILTRGYGGSLAGPIEVDRGRHAAHEVGDEALLLSAHARTVVARDRPAGAALAIARGASVIVMDDGLQNPSLGKDLRIAVVDGAGGVGNGLCVPAGPLRAPLADQMAMVDVVLVIGNGAAGEAVADAAASAGKRRLQGRLVPARDAVSRLSGQDVIAVSGIGRPEKFIATLEAAGARIASERAFGDHHAYCESDVAALIAEAKARDCLIATTEKDMTKLSPLWPETERGRLLVVPVTLALDDSAAFVRLLSEARAAQGIVSGLAGAAQSQQDGLR